MTDVPICCELCGRPLDESVAWMPSLIEGQGAHLECIEERYEEKEGKD